MKAIVKRALEASLVQQLSYLRKKYFPSKKQREILQEEMEAYDRRKVLFGSFIKKGELCFDVGANVGNRVGPLLDIGAKVIAIEPQENCCRRLKQKFGNRINIVPLGLGESEGVKNFYPSNANTISSFSEEWINSVRDGRFKEYSWKKPVKVNMSTLDILIEKYGLPVFIKIDVEGYELEVLKGLTTPIQMISFEYTVPEQAEIVLKCLDQIQSNDPNIEINYSVGESMDFALKNWLSVEEMKSYVAKREFKGTGFGDIYVKRRTP